MAARRNTPVARRAQQFEARQANAGRHKLSAVLRFLRLRVLFPMLRCYQLACGMYGEIRSTRGRIGVLLSKRRDGCRLPMVFRDATILHLRGRSLPDDCNGNIQELCAKFPVGQSG
jgi:hypothetical protein